MAEWHLCSGPDANPLLTRLRSTFRTAAATPGTALWLAPTALAAAAIRAQTAPLLQPLILPYTTAAIRTLQFAQPAIQPLSLAQQRWLLAEVVRHLVGRGELPTLAPVAGTPGLLTQVQQLVSGLNTHGVTPFDLARAVYAGGAAVPARQLLDRQLARICARYRQRCEQAHALDPATVFAQAARHLRHQAGVWTPVRSLFVDATAGLTRPQAAFVQALSSHMHGVWIALPDAANRAEVFACLQPTRAACTTQMTQAILPDCAPLRPVGLQQIVNYWGHTEPPVSAQADGVAVIAGPVGLGEWRLVLRRVRGLLDAGVPAAQIVLVARQVAPVADWAQAAATDYDVPLHLEEAPALGRVPAVRTLCAAAQLPDLGWPFAATTALLRSNYLAPDWLELDDDRERPLQAETLLRWLGVPRGHDAYVRAIHLWADSPPPALEDEEGEEPHRQRMQRLAHLCRPFLLRFFATWRTAPPLAPASAHTAWLRKLAQELGLLRVAAPQLHEQRCLEHVWHELDAWADSQRGRRVRREEFLRALEQLAATPAPAAPPPPACVCLLTAESARHAPCTHLFLVGLGEHHFPQLTPTVPLLTAGGRSARARLGLPDEQLLRSSELLLFYQLLTRPTQQLTLSYAAVDDHGQELLPSPLLTTTLQLFTPNAIPTERQRLPIERYAQQLPLSASETRVRTAKRERGWVWGLGVRGWEEQRELGRVRGWGLGGGGWEEKEKGTSSAEAALGTELISQSLSSHPLSSSQPPTPNPQPLTPNPPPTPNPKPLCSSQPLFFRQRPEYGPYDGLIRHPTALAEVQRRFGPERVFSPTALEAFTACPFKFLLQQVLRLEPLEEPAETIETTRRGSAYHRALARLHRQFRAAQQAPGATALVPAQTAEQLAVELSRAVEEYAARAPSAAARVLWQIEAERLRRSASKYAQHWAAFVAPWAAAEAWPQPTFLEADFGLPSTAGSAPLPALVVDSPAGPVRIGGRIDRVDVAELPDGVGFWVIDYKTGRASNYSATDVQELRKLQLPLYALALERVFFADRPSRPLGVAYWLVTDTGPKIVLPGGRTPVLWLTDPQRWPAFRQRLEAFVGAVVEQIRAGTFPLAPQSDHCTASCPYGPVCRIGAGQPAEKRWRVPLPIVPKEAA